MRHRKDNIEPWWATCLYCLGMFYIGAMVATIFYLAFALAA